MRPVNGCPKHPETFDQMLAQETAGAGYKHPSFAPELPSIRTAIRIHGAILFFGFERTNLSSFVLRNLLQADRTSILRVLKYRPVPRHRLFYGMLQVPMGPPAQSMPCFATV
jgi:hypothetical protein